jgi:hypothetical protein
MATINKNFITVVVLGAHNPQILTVDFLCQKGVLDPNASGFEILKREKKFVDFLSTPPFVRLDLGTIEFIIQQERFQIKESSISEWSESKAVRIARKYFEVLPHTPIRVIGINLNIKVLFDDQYEAGMFDQLLIPTSSRLPEIVKAENPIANMALRYSSPIGNGRATLTIGHPEKNMERSINFNFEFDYLESQDWQKLDRIAEFGEYFDSVVVSLCEAIRV